MLQLIRLGVRPAPRRRPGITDRLLGSSRRRRQAGYMAVAAGLHLLRPMLRRLALVAGGLVALALASASLRFIL